MAFGVTSFFLIVVIFLVCGCGGASASCPSSELELMLAEYERQAPPARPTRVALAFALHHASLHDGESALHVLADIKMKWQDSRLSWNASAWGCGGALVSAERVWVPDVSPASAGSSAGAGSDYDEQQVRARLASDGTVLWTGHLDLLVPLHVELELWPSDEQTATIKFASREHTLDELDLQLDNATQSTGWECGAWSMLSSVASVAVEARAGDGTSVAVARWTVRVRRRAAAQALATGAVLGAALLLLLAATLLPPTPRLPLAATATFITSLWLTTCVLRLPGAEGSPLVARVCCGGAYAGGACALLAAAALRLAARRSHPPPPPALRRVLDVIDALHITAIAPHEEWSGAWGAAGRALDAAARAALLLTLLVLCAVYVS